MLHTNKRKVYALFIGINNYRTDLVINGVFFPKLRGCVSDASAINAFLLKDPNLELHTLPLYNEVATKEAIVAAFRQHLSKAKASDVVLVYYSGHGTTEDTGPTQWPDEADRRLEAIVCYYTNIHSPDFLLTGKELRFLIHELYEKTKAHIVTIFDCCHSGDNTRGPADHDIVEKRVATVFPQRRWEEFLFAGEIEKNDLLNKPLEEVMPQGAHIQLAASESDEPAVEYLGRGAYTRYLLEALRFSQGRLSYSDLHSRVRNRMRAVFEQKPKLYAPDASQHLLLSGFLLNETGPSPNGKIDYNNAWKSWVLDKGVLQGITPGITEVRIDSPSAKGRVAFASLDHARVVFVDTGPTKLDELFTYNASLEGLHQRTVKIRFLNHCDAYDLAEEISGSFESEENAGILALDDGPQHVDFDVLLWKDALYFTRPGDWFRPLAECLPATAGQGATLATQLRHVAHWMYLRYLTNSDANALPPGSLHIDFFRMKKNGSLTSLAVAQGNEIFLPLDELNEPGKKWGGQIRIDLTNRAQHNLYVAALYFSEDFSCDTGLLEPAVTMIGSGESLTLWSHMGGIIPLQLDPKWFWYNWSCGRDTLKFVISTHPFESMGLQKAGLPPPAMPGHNGDRGELRSDTGISPMESWSTLDYALVIPNPEFNLHKDKKLNALLQFAGEPGGPAWLKNVANGLYGAPDAIAIDR